jgi:diguanylate cyclase
MSRNTGTGLKFVKRNYPPRILGMALGFLAVAMVLYQQQAPWLLWLFAVVGGFLWPHLAYLVASRSERPALAEHRNFVCDSALAGLWVPLLSFNLLPSLVLLSMVSLGNIALGGWRLLLKGLLAAAVSMLVGWLLIDFIWADYSIWLDPNLLTLAATAPLMVGYPLAIGVRSFALSRRLAGQRDELERVSRTDGLSQLNNRRYWEESAFREFERHKRSSSPLSLMMIDIDHFRQVNEKYGHVAGDQLICEISNLLTVAARQADVVGRYGGEEFGVLLPDTELGGALQFAERLRLGLQTLTVEPHGIRCTVSLGVAEVDAQVRKYRDLIEYAEKALNAAQQAGGNMTKAYEPE